MAGVEMADSELCLDTVLVTEDSFGYLRHYRWDDILRPTQSDERVKIAGNEEEGLFMIIIEGPQDIIRQVTSYVKGIVQQVKTTRFRIDSVSGLTPDDTLPDIELSYKCVMKYKTTRTHTTTSGGERKETVYTRVRDMKTTRIHGYLNTMQNVESEVIVNTTNKSLSLMVGKGVSKAIAKAGGEGIEKELRLKYPDGVDFGEVAVSGPGKLTNCKTVYHGALLIYKGVGKVELDHCYGILVLFILNCLNTATSQGYKSIAFPALGTGSLQYPLQNVVQLLYQTVRRFLDKNPRSSLEDVSFVIYPSTTSLIKQLFVMENLSSRLNTLRGDGITSLHDEMMNIDRGCCEARLQVGNTFIQVLNSDVKSVCELTKNVLILWRLNDVEVCASNPFLACVDPTIQEHVNTQYLPKLIESKCLIDKTSLPGQTVIHSVYSKDDVKHAKKAVCDGIKLAIKEELFTLTIPVVSEGSPLWQPHSAAEIIMNAIRQTKPVNCIISIAIPSGQTFEPFVAMAMESTDRKLHISPDTTTVLDTVWSSFSSRDDGAPGDAVLSVTSDSEDTNKKAAEDYEKRLGMKIVYTMKG